MSIISRDKDKPSPAEADQPNASSPPPSTESELDVETLVAEVKRAFAPLERELVGFGPLLTQAVYALLTGENLLVFSPPGTAKTLFARLLFQRIDGASVFDTQMSKGSLAEELFGSVDIEQMKAGRVLHNTRATLVDADLAFIDEFFDANDMVLRALLGIFHERVFKKGTQTEPARLHTGIAAANYVRATNITQAVVDRFLFRATIAPDYHPYTLLAIDQAFGRHYGEREAVAGGRVPLTHLTRLASLVRGELPQREITAPPHVLFMKNALINRYRELLTQRSARTDGGASAPYISPRTYAKSRLVLNAAAMMRGRAEVSCEDLSQLRYVVTTIGGPELEAKCFEDALKWTLTTIRDTDREHVDRLIAAQELAEQLLQRVETGEHLPRTHFLQRLLKMFGLISVGDLTFHHVRRFVDDIFPRDEHVKQLKQKLIGRLQELTRRIDFDDDHLFG